MRKLITCLCLWLVMFAPNAALAESAPVLGASGGGITASHSDQGESSPKATKTHVAKKIVKRAGTYVLPKYYATLTYGANGWCIIHIRAKSEAEYVIQRPAADARIEQLIQHGGSFDPACLNPATGLTNNPAQLSLQSQVDSFWADQHNLPAPTLKVTPEVGITGLRTHLSIDNTGPTTVMFNDPLLAEPIYIDATPTYEVNWGDSNVDTTTSNGGPSSDLYNVYEDIGFYDIHVTAHWEATWRVGQTGLVQGELSGLSTEATLPRLEIDDIQAVEVPNP